MDSHDLSAESPGSDSDERPSDERPSDGRPKDGGSNDGGPNGATRADPQAGRAWLNSIRRSSSDRIFGGVAAGLAESLGIPTLAARLGFLVASLTGFGIVLYALGWLLIPSDDEGTTATARSKRIPLAVAGLAAVLVMAVLTNGYIFSANWLAIALVLGGLVLLLKRPTSATGPVPPHTAAPDPAQAWTDAHGVVHGPADQSTGGSSSGASSLAVGGPDTARSSRIRRQWALPVVGLTTWSLILAVAGILGLLTIAGVISVGPGTMSAVALIILGGGLVFSAFRGRARGLIVPVLVLTTVLGLLGALDMRIDSLAPTFDVTVSDQAQLPTDLQATVGTSTLDLFEVELSSDHRLRIEQTLGTLNVVLPANTTVRIEATVGLGVLAVFKFSRVIAAETDTELSREWAETGLPDAGSPVDARSIRRHIRDPQSMNAERWREGLAKSTEFTINRSSKHTLTLDVSLGQGTVNLIDPHWDNEPATAAKPTQLCTVGGGPRGVVKPCDEIEASQRVALCINDFEYLVDCREDREAEPGFERIAACRGLFADHVDCSNVGIEPVAAELISPGSEALGNGFDPSEMNPGSEDGEFDDTNFDDTGSEDGEFDDGGSDDSGTDRERPPSTIAMPDPANRWPDQKPASPGATTSGATRGTSSKESTDPSIQGGS